MRRILFGWRGLEIHSYTALLYLGLVLGLIAQNYAAVLTGLDSLRVYLATIVLLIPALVGARLLFVLSHWQWFAGHPPRIWRRSEGGAALYGGLAFAVPLSVPLLAALGIAFWEFWDVATYPMLIGAIFTRIGCLLHGCCGGRPSEGRIALWLPDHHGMWQRRIPTQLLEIGWAAALLLGAVAYWISAPFAGALFLSAVAAYAVGRLALLPLRADRPKTALPSLAQALSGALIVLSIAGCFVLRIGMSWNT
jgi:phosphatidylglycerol---prolipoprotein diacylglyceryl transferase